MFLSREIILSHINDSEKVTLLRRIIDKMEISIRDYSVQFSDFLDPYERKLVESLSTKVNTIVFKELPSDLNLERKVIAFGPDFDFINIDNAISVFQIENTFNKLDHRSVLGSLLGLGITREKIGDIAIHEKVSYVFVKKEVAKLIIQSLDKVGKYGVKVKEVDISEFHKAEEELIIAHSVVSSMRLDSVLSEVLKSSRSKTKSLISRGYVKVDHRTITTPHFEVSKALVSIRGFGRIRILEDIKETRKGRIRFSYGILKKE